MERALSLARPSAVSGGAPSLTLAGPRFHSQALAVPSRDLPFRYGGAKVCATRGFRHLRAVSCAGVDAIGAVGAGEEQRSSSPIIVIDNYDSFTYNLCQYMGELGADFEVYRNDELTIEEIKWRNPRGILISPGPGTPQDSGISLQIVLHLGPSTPIFGVCMGLQCIGEAFGGKIVRSPYGVMHGKGSLVYYDEKGEDGLLAGLSNPFTAGRYHSLVIENESFPSDVLEITAWTQDGLVMAARHKRYKHIQVPADTMLAGLLYDDVNSYSTVIICCFSLFYEKGVQFHPESIITSEGKTIVRNFLKLIDRREKESE